MVWMYLLRAGFFVYLTAVIWCVRSLLRRSFLCTLVASFGVYEIVAPASAILCFFFSNGCCGHGAACTPGDTMGTSDELPEARTSAAKSDSSMDRTPTLPPRATCITAAVFTTIVFTPPPKKKPRQSSPPPPPSPAPSPRAPSFLSTRHASRFTFATWYLLLLPCRRT